VRIGHLDITEFAKWSRRIDSATRALVDRKIDYLAFLGDDASMPLVRRLGGELHELRVGKYRLYFTFAQMDIDGQIERGMLFVAYGEKDTQRRDIARARGRL